MRTLFNKPIRKSTTESFFSHKIGFKEFIDDLRNSTYPFEENMKNLEVSKEEKYPEEWYELFLSWSEVEVEPETE